jgi:hypothetical protein
VEVVEEVAGQVVVAVLVATRLLHTQYQKVLDIL